MVCKTAPVETSHLLFHPLPPCLPGARLVALQKIEFVSHVRGQTSVLQGGGTQGLNSLSFFFVFLFLIYSTFYNWQMCPTNKKNLTANLPWLRTPRHRSRCDDDPLADPANWRSLHGTKTPQWPWVVEQGGLGTTWYRIQARQNKGADWITKFWVGPSLLPHAGLGLFAAVSIRKSRRVGYFCGVDVTEMFFQRGQEWVDEYRTTINGGYLLKLTGNRVLQTRHGASGLQRMNDKHRQVANNVRMYKGRASASRNIREGDELTVSYGAAYWKTQNKLTLHRHAAYAVDRVFFEESLAVAFTAAKSARLISV